MASVKKMEALYALVLHDEMIENHRIHNDLIYHGIATSTNTKDTSTIGVGAMVMNVNDPQHLLQYHGGGIDDDQPQFSQDSASMMSCPKSITTSTNNTTAFGLRGTSNATTATATSTIVTNDTNVSSTTTTSTTTTSTTHDHTTDDSKKRSLFQSSYGPFTKRRK